MKKLILPLTFTGALLLGACSNIGIEKREGSEKDTTESVNKERETDKQEINEQTEEHTNQISEDEAIEKAKEVFSSSVYHEFKIDSDRSNDAEYFITFLLNDAVGTPQKSATTVNKQSGEVGDYLDDRTEEDIENYIKFVRESPKYKGSTEKFEKQARENKTRPNDNEREVNQQQPNEEPNQQQTEQSPEQSNQPSEQPPEVDNPARDQAIKEGIDMNNPTDEEIERMRELAKDSPHGLQSAPSQGGQ